MFILSRLAFIRLGWWKVGLNNFSAALCLFQPWWSTFSGHPVFILFTWTILYFPGKRILQTTFFKMTEQDSRFRDIYVSLYNQYLQLVKTTAAHHLLIMLPPWSILTPWTLSSLLCNNHKIPSMLLGFCDADQEQVFLGGVSLGKKIICGF